MQAARTDRIRASVTRRPAWGMAACCLCAVALCACGCAITPRQRQVAAFRAALDHVEHDYIVGVDRRGLQRAAMRALVDELDDPYSAYLTPEQMQREFENQDGAFGGIGLVTMRDHGLPVVVRTLPGGPAQAAGIRAGDVITHADGRDLRDLSADDVMGLLRGRGGTRLRLRLRRHDEPDTIVLTITRQRIVLPNVECRTVEEHIGYVHILAFHDRCAREVRDALQQLLGEGIKGLVLDLRGDGGGSVHQALAVCDMLLNEGVIVVEKGRELERERRASAHVLVPRDMPIVILVDPGTASAAEIVAGAMQACGRARLVGMRTFGKGSGTILRPLPDGSGVRVTGRRYELSGGVPIEGRGIEPDVVVGDLSPLRAEATAEEVVRWRQAKDALERKQLNVALECLRKELQQLGE